MLGTAFQLSPPCRLLVNGSLQSKLCKEILPVELILHSLKISMTNIYI